ncbi:indolepyruvate ferredoxin oxidoreductase alpha subunit [Planktotalea frisia]|uniref:Indolepyruvate ferredoxin oxidoreductase n=1 Tax=Planktotalea frisia TaxID=696762 RepID=A0A1L9NX86_9RHOB|nr:indolepyruvate ferredoxin oxidoreductase subunit alpha [Planktotalea frisia]OJI93851.1 indolepyruvate ferredoxin oxidoreductase [Planktotalea frisia]PZX29775.1 indolepyruvate ferredoxin oxidoreductase alpha subunit [Planktotalea frisia]
MAERSFAKEVQHLKIGAGETFRGEGILAITKALLENGVGYVAGYQGSPISHLMDVLADAQDILSDMGVHFEASASEATAAATLAASVHYPIRGAVTFKSTVGTNVASDALANLASGGVTGGALVIVGEDYGEGSSIMQERSHAFAMKSQIWLLDPRPNLPSMVKAVGDGFALSEASNSPVMLQLRIKSCHLLGEFEARENVRPSTTVKDALENPKRDVERIVLPPASYLHEQEKVTKRLPAAIEYIRANKLNEHFGPKQGKVGIICQGGHYNGVIRALQRLGLANMYGDCDVPLHVLNVTYPLLDDKIIAFAKDKDSLFVIEEGHPAYIEQNIRAILHKAGARCAVEGKGPLPEAGELTGQILLDGLSSYFSNAAPDLMPSVARAPNAPPQLKMPELADTVPARPPSFCIGCPERPIFAATKLVEEELGPHHIASDIGCHLFSINAPFDLGSTTMGYGLGPASASAFNDKSANRRSISFLGDGGFWHNGLTSSIGNAVFNENDGVIIIVDNYYSAATGGQDILSSRADNVSKSTQHPIKKAVEGMGVKWVRQIDRTYDVGKMQATLKEALETPETGPKVIIASSECMLNKQRREKPLAKNAVSEGKRMTRTRFGVDEDVCTGDHACIRLSGCPSLSLKTLDDPLRDDPVASIDQNCVGCGNCGEVADAAVLCPSFYQADLIQNPSKIDRTLSEWRTKIITKLQKRRDARRLVFSKDLS